MFIRHKVTTYGGVIMVKMKPSLIIGLGGTGKLICKMLKSCFQERYNREFLDEGTGLPPTMDIIYIEADFGKEKEELQLPELPEVESIVAEIPERKFAAIQTKEYLDRNPEIKRWLAAPLPVKEIIDGAGQIRQAGRLAFFEHRKKDKQIEVIIRKKITYLTGDEIRRKANRIGIDVEVGIDVYLISSLCGGTGSGMMFDVAGVIKDHKRDAKVTLITLFPRVFTTILNVPESIQNMNANAYATLKELNHYMKYNPWEVEYSTKEKRRVGGRSENIRLFDYVFMVDIEGKTGKNLIDRLHLSPLIAEFLYQNLTSLREPLSSLRDNIDRYTTFKWCSGFGLSILRFPLEEVLAVCKSKIKREVLTKLSTGEYKSTEIEKIISDENIGLLATKFNYRNWMQALCKQETYHLQSAESIIASGKKKIYSQLRAEKLKAESELKEDKRKISENYPNVLDRVERELDEVVKEALSGKGLDYTLTLLNNLKSELSLIELKPEQESLAKSVLKLQQEIDKDLKIIQERVKSRFDIFGFWKKCEPNIRAAIYNIKRKLEGELKVEKMKYVMQLLNELTKEKGSIEKKIALIESLKHKLNQLRSRFRTEYGQAWDTLSFVASAETKLVANKTEVENFYNKYFQGEIDEIKKIFADRLYNWLEKDQAAIKEEIEKTIRERINKKGLDSLTLKDVVSKDELNRKIRDSFDNAAPFWQHVAKDPIQDVYLISGFTSNELQDYDVGKANDIFISDPVDRRRMVFLTFEYKVPLTSLEHFGLKEWAEDYREFITSEQPRIWIHLMPEALDFEDPLGMSISMEEADLLQTCRDFGIVYQKGNSYKYKEVVKKKGQEKEMEKTIGRGFDNCIKTLKNNPSLTKELRLRVIRVLNEKPIEEIQEYLRVHSLETYGYDYRKFFKAHKKLFKDIGSGKSIPSHRIPSYVEKEIQKRLETLKEQRTSQ